MQLTFLEYIDKKQRDAIKELRLIKRMLKQAGMQVASHLHDRKDDPYLFVYNPHEAPNFGLRIYKLGGKDIYFRPQKKEKTQPWGEAQTLDVEGIFSDVMSDKGDDDDCAAKEIIKGVADELKDFFKTNARAEKEINRDKGPLGAVAIRGSLDTGDYSNTTYSVNSGR